MQLTPSEVDVELERKQDEVQELHLTDDLADSLMNPPTEPEQSDEEPVHMEMKNETEEVLLEDQEVQGITEAVEEAKNKDMCSLAEEVQLVREPSPQVVRSQIEKEDAPSSMPETLVLEEEDCEKTETAAADVVEKVSAMEVDTVKDVLVDNYNVKDILGIGLEAGVVFFMLRMMAIRMQMMIRTG